ncbi:MAG TPA: DUF202 domain-containing protein [Pseudonocardia sp.]|jgi:uncharacterized membrane protein YidH (DUF202 family)|uniref:DUF202 domain-containing protein n=1 Tax=Pseudonocardia sp. TaxID=60912 RepID=UPI002CA53B19|nr:DUF202 domain-containing protein [Pseudonocardia sp.]HTF54858.1 DUF202 domain-containing protein [Pseudonocardia sp.]
MTARRSPDDGLQPERTALAWSRTSQAVLANGALLLLRDTAHYGGPLRFLPAAAAMVIAGATYLIGRRRLAVLNRRPLPARLAPRRQVTTIGWAVIALIVVTSVLLTL